MANKAIATTTVAPAIHHQRRRTTASASVARVVAVWRADLPATAIPLVRRSGTLAVTTSDWQ